MNLKELLEQSTPLPWHGRITNVGSAHEQGLIIDEQTGANVAVTYDPKDAALVVHAVNMLPKLVEALEQAVNLVYDVEGDPAYRAFRRVSGEVLAEANNPEVSK